MALLARLSEQKIFSEDWGEFRRAGNSVKSLFLSENQQEKVLFYQKASTLKIQTWFPG
jgi:hypothetical protein